jgi:ATP-binding cassette subfamily C (CFTR/MRP) protein 1
MILAAFDLALLVMWVKKDSAFKSRAAVPSAALSFVGALILCLWSYFEHMRMLRTSFWINVYLCITMLFDIARSRTFALDKDLNVISIQFTTRIGVKLFLAFFEAKSKEPLYLPDFTDAPPEAIAGVYNRALFWWQNQMFRKGFSNALSLDELFQLDKHLYADYLQRRIEPAWARCEFPLISRLFDRCHV